MERAGCAQTDVFGLSESCVQTGGWLLTAMKKYEEVQLIKLECVYYSSNNKLFQ